MEGLFGEAQAAAALQSARDWVLEHAANAWTLGRVALLPVLFGLAFVVTRRLRPLLKAWVERSAIPARFADGSFDFVLRFWIRDPQGGIAGIKGEVLLAVWDAFKEHGILAPYPHRHLMVAEPIPGGDPERTVILSRSSSRA